MALPAEDPSDIDFGDSVDLNTFEQILDMDEGDDEREFSKSIVFGFLDQATETFDKMDAAITAKNLPELSQLGHFLKGSSATLGFTHVKDECEKIQHYGAKKDETGNEEMPDEQLCLKLIGESLAVAKSEFAVVDRLMRRYFA